jgi:colanic acid/amylovoran biosynthesis glycosyltransferase
MDLYRFFGKRPSIILVRRGREYQTDPTLSVYFKPIPLAVKGVEDASLGRALSAVFTAILYLLDSIVICFRVRESGHVIRLVHAHYVLPQGLFALFIACFLRVPLIVSATGTDVNVVMKRSVIGRVLCRLILNRAYATIAVSEPLQNWMCRFGVTNSTYLPNSIDVSSIPPLARWSRPDRILFVGRLDRNKRPLVLIQAFEEVARYVPTATLLMCGEGPLKESVLEEIVKRGLGNRVQLYQSVSPVFLNALRSEAGLFVLPSASEGLSFALLEGMAAGQTVIASRNESHSAVIVDGENGLLFELDNSKDLASKIMAAIADWKLRARLGRSARRLCETRFSNDIVALKLERLYLGAINSRTALTRNDRFGWKTGGLIGGEISERD